MSDETTAPLPAPTFTPLAGSLPDLETRLAAIEAVVLKASTDIGTVIPTDIETRLTTLETDFEKVVSIIETAIGPLETLAVDVEHKKILSIVGDSEKVLADLPSFMTDFAELKAMVKGI
jgi:hypothetical protein